jgi:hypothetical protein
MRKFFLIFSVLILAVLIWAGVHQKINNTRGGSANSTEEAYVIYHYDNT